MEIQLISIEYHQSTNLSSSYSAGRFALCPIPTIVSRNIVNSLREEQRIEREREREKEKLHIAYIITNFHRLTKCVKLLFESRISGRYR